MIAILMLVVGLIALCKGKLKVTRNRILYGASARTVAVVLALPFVVSFAIGIAIGLDGGDLRMAEDFWLVELALAVGGAILATLLAFVLPPGAKPGEAIPEAPQNGTEHFDSRVTMTSNLAHRR
jgi:hypothetical protein